MLKVFNNPCNNCLFSKNRLVSPARFKEIIEECKREQNFFVCHVATLQQKEIACNAFYNKMGDVSQLIRLAKLLDTIEFVEQPKK